MESRSPGTAIEVFLWQGISTVFVLNSAFVFLFELVCRKTHMSKYIFRSKTLRKLQLQGAPSHGHLNPYSSGTVQRDFVSTTPRHLAVTTQSYLTVIAEFRHLAATFSGVKLAPTVRHGSRAPFPQGPDQRKNNTKHNEKPRKHVSVDWIITSNNASFCPIITITPRCPRASRPHRQRAAFTCGSAESHKCLRPSPPEKRYNYQSIGS